jgi:Tol biopolymer transport system component
MANGRWQNAQVFSIFHLPSAIQDAFFSILLDREPAPLARFEPNVPNELQRIVSKAVRKAREQRYQVMKDLLLDLQALRDGLTAQTRSTTKERGKLARHPVGAALGACVIALMAAAVWWTVRTRGTGEELTAKTAPVRNTVLVRRSYTRLTIASGLQTDVAWSADGRFIAYASDQAGNFDIWVQPISGGDAVQVTRSPAQERQPAWSPDNNSIVFRSERDAGGLYVIPAFGGPEQQLAAFGVRPQWMQDGAHVVFASTDLSGLVPKLYMVGLDGRPPQQILQNFTDGLLATRGWRLHPDGRRISVLASTRTKQEGLFTVPLSGGPPVLSKDSTDHQRLMTGGSRGFTWSPSGAALFLERLERAKTDLWRLVINPETLEHLTAERLTTGGGVHKGPAVSPDGKRLAFTTETQAQRLWSFPLEPGTSRVKGTGTPITEAGAQALTFDLTRDGRKLAYALAREGVDREELWVLDLVTGDKQLLSVERVRGWQQWSPDGNKMAYPVFRWTDKSQTQGETALVIRRIEAGGEEGVTTFTPFQGSGAPGLSRSKYMTVWDWTPDSQELVVGSDQFTPSMSLYLVPLRSAPHAETAKKLLASDPRYNLWQANVSPNGRWIAFMAYEEQSGAATIAVMPTTGAAAREWTHVTDAREWADKPRWSPDGKLLYFIGRRTSFFNVWAVRFDPETGKAIGAPFQVTDFNSPGFQFSTRLAYGDLSVSSTQLIVPIMETSGNIWMLDNIDR